MHCDRWRGFTFFLSLAAALLMTACGVPYKPASFWGASGYSSKDIDAETVVVDYLSGATASVSHIQDYALYRCAEITLERGYDGFVILKKGGYSIAGTYGYTTSATVKMRMFKGRLEADKRTADVQEVYDAAALKARLELRIEQ